MSLDLTDVSTPDCCATVVRESLDPAAAEQHARVFKALGDPTRLRLLSIVAAHDGAEACVCDLTEPVGLAQATVSHHLKVLVDAGLLTRSQRGKWGYYALVPGALDQVARSLADVAPESLIPHG
ncbi:putative transcriptional regulator, ArsR family protein [Luteimicrobium album]|uniref:Transcriptional regulator, ArsR family protein n=1 Tax=Luteimicrobium album TaxID=1054550 RepID=A0ABQ6HXQ4_9MICO|nr:metalloregulator ArsR/SmtB family transcription factor [Luteimicrobium album]GMA23276.1 putative transcriptional regulator, ArsR family protein [Luteimicrobium album]